MLTNDKIRNPKVQFSLFRIYRVSIPVRRGRRLRVLWILFTSKPAKYALRVEYDKWKLE